MGATHATGKEPGVEVAHRWHQPSISPCPSAETSTQYGRFEHLLRKMYFKKNLGQYGSCTGKQHTGFKKKKKNYFILQVRKGLES